MIDLFIDLIDLFYTNMYIKTILFYEPQYIFNFIFN